MCAHVRTCFRMLIHLHTCICVSLPICVTSCLSVCSCMSICRVTRPHTFYAAPQDMFICMQIPCTISKLIVSVAASRRVLFFVSRARSVVGSSGTGTHTSAGESQPTAPRRPLSSPGFFRQAGSDSSCEQAGGQADGQAGG